MREPKWPLLLDFLYTKEATIEFPLNHDDEITESSIEESTISEKIDLNNKEIIQTIDFCEKQELIEKVEQDYKYYPPEGSGRDPQNPQSVEISLLPKGFDTIHERRLKNNQRRTNIGLAVLTGFLVMGSLLQGYSAYLSHNSSSDKILLVGILIISGFLMLSMIGFMMNGDILGVFRWIKNGENDAPNKDR